MALEKQKRHIGKMFKFKLDHVDVYAFCIWHDKKYGYLLKWFPKDTSLETMDPVEDAPFIFAYVLLDQAMRRGDATVVGRLEDFLPYRPLMRLSSVANPDDGSVPWFLEYGDEKYERVSMDDPRLPSLSDSGLAGTGYIDEMYLRNRTPEKQFRVLCGLDDSKP